MRNPQLGEQPNCGVEPLELHRHSLHQRNGDRRLRMRLLNVDNAYTRRVGTRILNDAGRSDTCITRRGDLVTYPASELRFEYRRTNIPDPLIVSATFDLRPTDPIALRRQVKEIFAFKKSTQPLADSSAGCAFKNPIDPVTEKRVPAGRLIEEAGLKGLTVGGASISHHHANFIVARPMARAEDVLKVLELVRRRVYEHCGVERQREVVVWRRGEEDESPEERL